MIKVQGVYINLDKVLYIEPKEIKLTSDVLDKVNNWCEIKFVFSNLLDKKMIFFEKDEYLEVLKMVEEYYDKRNKE